MLRSERLRLMILAFSALLLSLSVGAMAGEKKDQAKVALKVTQGGCDNTGFCCAHCQDGVKKALEGVAGVSKVTMNKEKKEIIVEYDKNKVKLEDLQKATEKAGFKVAPAKESKA